MTPRGVTSGWLALASDARSVLLRGKAPALLVGCGILAGVFTRVTGAPDIERHLHQPMETAPLTGSGVEILLSTLFALALACGAVQGARLAHGDRASGFLVLAAVRPVPRLALGGGRLLGLIAVTFLSVALLALPALPLSGALGEAMPSPRVVDVARRMEIDGREIPRGSSALLGAGAVARFEFDAEAAPDLELRITPRTLPGVPFSGQSGVRARLVPASGPVEELTFESLRAHQRVQLSFPAREGSGAFAVEIRLTSPGCVLELDHEALRALGAARAKTPQLLLALLLMAVAAALVAAIAYFLCTALSFGPAALATAFFWLLAQGRAGVLDLIAGIGREGGGAESGGGRLTTLARDALEHAVRLVPDLAPFDASSRLGAGLVVAPDVAVLGLTTAALTLAALALLSAAALPFEER